MPAQPGSAVLLSYSNQGPQQPGSAVLLSYEPPASEVVLKTLREVRNPWVQSRGQLTAIQVAYSQAGQGDVARKAPWGVSKGLAKETLAWWSKITAADNTDKIPWGKYEARLYGSNTVLWKDAVPADNEGHDPWSKFGPMLNEDRYVVWNGSKPADKYTLVIFQQHSIPVWVYTPWPRPNGLAANFFVVGGSPMEITFVDSVADQYLPLQVNFSADTYVPHYLGDPLRQYYHVQPNAVNFTPAPLGVITPLLDSNGVQVIDKSARDVPKLNPWGAQVKSDREQWIPWTRYSRPMDAGWGSSSNSSGPVTGTDGTILVPVRSTYIVLNEVKLVTVPGGLELPVQTATLTIDNSSWVYGFTASLPGYCLSYVLSAQLLAPIELDLIINGEEYRVLVEKVARNREFGKTGITISGRGQLAYLSAPYSPVQNFTNTEIRTAEQLMVDALTTNGVSLGWTVDWQLPTWTVPANVWGQSGTYMDAALSIVESVEGWIIPDPKFKILKAMSKYPYLHRVGGGAGVLEPTMPWEWNLATPGIILPSSVVKVEGVEWIEKPGYNAVYVSGTNTGVIGHVKVTGTAGDLVAPERNHPLITTAEAAGEAGRAILGDTGRMAMVTLSLPVLTEVGVIYPGVLVKYTDGATTMLGISRSLSISSGKMEELIQTIEIEVH